MAVGTQTGRPMIGPRWKAHDTGETHRSQYIIIVTSAQYLFLNRHMRHEALNLWNECFKCQTKKLEYKANDESMRQNVLNEF